MNRRVVPHHGWWMGRCRAGVGTVSGRVHPLPTAGSYSGPVATGGSTTGGPGPYGGRGNGLRVTRTVSIPWDEISWRATSPGGPGGQHANRRSTRVEVSVDVEHAAWLGPRQRSRVTHQLGPVVRAVAGEHRSQARNRELALERLARRIEGALRPRAPRVPTAPSLGATERRLRAKRERSERKRSRRPPEED